MQRLFVFGQTSINAFWACLEVCIIGVGGGLDRKAKSVFNGCFRAFNDTTFALEVQSSYGFNLLEKDN